MSLRIKIYAGFVAICLIWGSSWAAVKLGLETVPPILSLGIRFSLASIILGTIIYFKRFRLPLDKNKFWMLVTILCFTSFTIPFVLIYWAQIQINSGIASVLFATYPFWVAMLSHYFLPDEKITFPRMLGMILGFLGVIIIFNDGFTDVNIKTLLGMIAIIAGAVMQAFGLIALRKYGEDIHPVTLNFWPMLISAISLSIISYGVEDYSNIVFTQNAIISLVYLALFCTAITFVIYFWLVKQINVVILSLSAFITPIIAVFIALMVMEEKFTGIIYVGSFLVIVGVGIANIGDIFSVRQTDIIKER